MLKGLGGAVAALAVAAFAMLPAAALADGITGGGSDLRDGWYPQQPRLSPQVVSGGTFGRLWDAPVTGQVYAQPLVDGDTVLVVTESNDIYGLDAQTGARRWTHNLGRPFDPVNDLDGGGCADLVPTVGATATPVIDPSTHVAYLTHKTYSAAGVPQWWLDAIDTRTGAAAAGFPVMIEGRADNAPAQVFSPRMHLQRPGLLLMGGAVYAAFGGHCDRTPYQGWVFGVSTTGTIKARWTTVAGNAGDSGAGIWQSGSGLMSDGPGRLFVSTGNGASPAPPLAGSAGAAKGVFGESIVRLGVRPDGTLRADDFFAPYDAADLDTWDADFASGGVTALRDDVFGTASFPHLAVAVGKAGYVYLLDRDNLGGIGMASDGGDAAVFRRGSDGGVWSRPAVWPGDGGWIYVPTATGDLTPWGTSGFLKVYRYGETGAGRPALSLDAESDEPFSFGSSAPVVTSDGTASGSALVWVVWAPAGSGIWQLRAYDAVPQGGRPVLRYSAPIGAGTKFNPPGVGDGRIYVGTRDGHVLGFGAPVSAQLEGPSTTFPTTTVGQSSTRTVTLKATRHTVLTGIAVTPSAFAADTVSRTLEAGDTVAVPVTFTPTQAGTVGGSLNATTTTGTFSFGLTGTAQAAAAKLAASPAVVSFGGTTVGRTVDATMTFKNVGGTTLDVTSIDLPQAPFVLDQADLPARLAPEQSATVGVHLRPTQPGSFTDQVTLHTSAGDGVVGLSGTAGIGGRLALDAPAFDLGDVRVGRTAIATLTVSNTGDAAMTIMKSKPPAAAAFKALDELVEGTTIAAGGSRSLRVRFAPGVRGAASAVWTITVDDRTGEHNVRFSGRGTEPELDAPASVGFGDVPVGHEDVTAVTLTNIGDHTVTVTASEPPAGNGFAALDPLRAGTTIAPGAGRVVRIRFLPTVAGPAAASWTLTADDARGARRVDITGTGLAGPAPPAESSQQVSPPATDPGPPGPPVLDPQPPGPPLTSGAGAAADRARPALRFSRPRTTADGSRLVVAGLLSKLATGRVQLSFAARSSGRTVTVTASAAVRQGRFTATLRVPARIRGWQNARIEARYAGNRAVWAGSAALVLVRR